LTRNARRWQEYWSGSEEKECPGKGYDFSDAQAAIARIMSDEPGPGQQYALKARKWIAQLRAARPGINIEALKCGVPSARRGGRE